MERTYYMKTSALANDVVKVINTESHDPYSVLGLHPVKSEQAGEQHFAVRVFFPNAKSVNIIILHDGSTYKMKKLHENGFFEVIIKDKKELFAYKIEVMDFAGKTFQTYDPYCFLPVLTDFDLHLFKEGNHHKIFEKLGAHIMTINSITGTLFAVWAPCAKRVSVIGDFNQWDGRSHQMRCLGSS